MGSLWVLMRAAREEGVEGRGSVGGVERRGSLNGKEGSTSTYAGVGLSDGVDVSKSNKDDDEDGEDDKDDEDVFLGHRIRWARLLLARPGRSVLLAQLRVECVTLDVLKVSKDVCWLVYLLKGRVLNVKD